MSTKSEPKHEKKRGTSREEMADPAPARKETDWKSYLDEAKMNSEEILWDLRNIEDALEQLNAIDLDSIRWGIMQFIQTGTIAFELKDVRGEIAKAVKLLKVAQDCLCVKTLLGTAMKAADRAQLHIDNTWRTAEYSQKLRGYTLENFEEEE